MPAPKNSHPLCLLIGMRKGKVETIDTITEPNPRLTKRIGIAQQTRVIDEEKNDKRLENVCFHRILTYLLFT